jgi:prolyl-tRNA synthetase
MFGADPGSLGPVGIEDIPIIADRALEGRRNLVCGANRDDYHLVNVTPEVDFPAPYADIREVQEGDPCPSCETPLKVAKAIEIGHIFKLGLKYSSSMKATVLDADGQEVPLVMGSYGIGVERILAAAVELYNDDLGMVLPKSIAPFQVVVTLLRPDNDEHRALAEGFYDELNARGIDCLLDDRDERPGVKFKDAELIGIPLRITLGRKLAQGEVEIFSRAKREAVTATVEKALETAERMLNEYPH